jgi:hypothetical protein
VRTRDRSGSRNGSIVAATWLIGLGLLFLVQQLGDLEWSRAWPLFVVLVGVGSGVSELVWMRRPGVRLWALTWPLVLIAVGILFFLSTSGLLGLGLGDLVRRWWPVALIVIGAWYLLGAVWPGSHRSTERLALPLEAAQAADVRIRFGAGELTVGSAAAGMLVEGDFEGGVVHRLGGPGLVELSQDAGGLSWFDRRHDWRFGVTAEVPLDLRVETGASRALLDLRGMRLRTLTLQTGASETRVALPSAAGESVVRAETGAAQLTIEVPAGVGARIRSRMALGRTSVDTDRFPRSGDGYESAGYASAPNRVEIDIQGGVGSVRIIGTR